MLFHTSKYEYKTVDRSEIDILLVAHWSEGFLQQYPLMIPFRVLQYC
jgi:hypothetical protein